jgi:phage gpG-like protein
MTTQRIELIRCVTCGEEKTEEAFAKDKRRPRGRVSRCRPCQKVLFAAFYSKNKASICARTSSYQKEKGHIQKAAKKRWQDRNKDAHLASRRDWHARKFAGDLGYRLNFVIRGALRRTLDAAKRNNVALASAALPYSAADLKARIEMNFLPGMHWDNHGDWHVDHRVPVARLIRRGVADPAVVNCLANLAPLWAEDNYRKGKR